jgi:2-amino-4-hydroxy-6-hydroxymethyldihydropteridine diphosphokinase
MFLIALGSNLSGTAGSPRDGLEAALCAMKRHRIRVVAQSGWWRSPAYPPGSGPDFVNAAARVEAALEPQALLAALHEVEAELGRSRPRRWAPRVCDLDLLAAGDAIYPDRATVAAWMALPPAEQAERTPDRLLLPHPRLHERAFVLVPLLEVAPDWRHPILDRTVREMFEALPRASFEGLRHL